MISMEHRSKNAARSTFGNAMIVLGGLLIAAALGLAAYNILDAKRAEKASHEITDQLVEEIGHRTEDGTTPSPYADKDAQMPTAVIDGYEYIGILEIPGRSLSLPVMSTWDYDRLQIAACLFTGSYYSNDIVICAHNYANFFMPLITMAIGEDVYFTNVEGMTIHYIVTNRETVQPTDVEGMTENISNSGQSTMDWDMTLFTCNLGGQTRCAVRCKRVE